MIYANIILLKIRSFTAPVQAVFTPLDRMYIHCRSKNVIYLVTCKTCKIQYVGSTSNEFKVRFRNHKSAMLTNKATCELAVHFKRKEHHMSDFEFIVIEKIVNDTTDDMDKVLLTREAFWCAQLCTLQPYGLNKRSEFKSHCLRKPGRVKRWGSSNFLQINTIW